MSDSHGDSAAPRAGQPTVWSLRTALDPVEQIAAELRERWQHGERVGIDDCRPLFERVAGDAERLLDLIYHEILLREEYGEHPEAREYVTRFPQLQERIPRLFEVHRAVASEPAPEDEDEWGPVPPGYEILQEVGRGGMAVVYRARQRTLQRLVALKMVSLTRHASPEMWARFRQEAQAVAQLQHANIVQVFEVGQVRGRPYLALEFVAGGTLQGRLDGRPLAPESAAQLIETLARAVHYAHGRGVVHRDLKPANILLESLDGGPSGEIAPGRREGVWVDTGAAEVAVFRPKVSDFGLAKAAQFDSDLTVTGQILGTPSYMSPEQAAARTDAAAAASDIYSLGAILYQLLTGRPPFHGTSMLDVLDQVRKVDPPRPRRLQPKVPRDLETICLHCLEKSPERRYATAEQLADDLRRYLDHTPIAARRSAWYERAWKGMRRRPVVTLLSAASALSLLGAVGGISWQTLQVHEYAQRAQDERDHARRLHRTAIAQRDQAEQLRAQAEILQAESQRNFQRAFQAVAEIRQKGNVYYLRADQMEVGRELLEFTVKYYEGFLDDESQDPAVRQAACLAFDSAGEIVGRMGDRQRAATFLERAIVLREQFVSEQPEQWELRRELALAWRRLGNARRHLDQRSESEQAYLAAEVHFARALELQPASHGVRTQLANSLVNRASLLYGQRRATEAQRLYVQAESLLRQAIAGSHLPSPRAELALCLDDQAEISQMRGDETLTQQQIEEAFQLRRELLAAGWVPTEAVKLLARSHLSRARAYLRRQQADEARGECQQAITLLTGLAAQNPLRLDLQQEFPRTLTCQAMLLAEARENAAASELFFQALDVSSRLVARFPSDPVVARAWAHQQYVLGEFLLACGDVDEARLWIDRSLASYAQVAARWPASVRTLIDQAWVLATCPLDDRVDTGRARKLAEEARKLDPTDAGPLSVLGVVQYRAGDWTGAVETLGQVVGEDVLDERSDALFLALASYQQGDSEAARRWLARYDRTPSRDLVNLLEDRRLGREADALRESLSPPDTSTTAVPPADEPAG